MNRIIGFSSVLATIIITAVIGNVWMFLILNNHVFTTSTAISEENNNTNVLKEIENVPNDRYLKSNVTINGFKLTDLALTNERKQQHKSRDG